MIIKCPICKEIKEGVGPKIIGQKFENDPRFNRPLQSLEHVVMCNECLVKYKKGEIDIKLKGVVE